jgi:hypothetical protein
MEVINVPFVVQEDDETCALLKPDLNVKRPPVNVVVEEVMKVLNLYPEVRQRVKQRLAVGK